MNLLHETEYVDTRDRFFVCGGNPDGSGGGVIGTRDTWDGATSLKVRAIVAGYTDVRIWNWKEMMEIE
jgi:hypothetical protein